jgi:sulfur-oxidizing protein SoxX
MNGVVRDIANSCGGHVSRGAVALVFLLVSACATVSSGNLAAYQVTGDEIRAPLFGLAGDVAGGREVLVGRDGNCLLCHAVPEAGARFMGDLGPPLSGVGATRSAAQLRLRVVDSRRLNAESIMPAYYAVEGLDRVGETWRGKPILTAQQVEDIVAYLLTLR